MFFNKELKASVDELNESVKKLTSVIELSGANNETAVAPSENAEVMVANSPRHFVDWLREGIISGDLQINQAGSTVHIVDEGVFLLAPAIFKQYLKAQCSSELLHNNLSKRFSRLRIHIQGNDGINIHSYWVITQKNRASKINGWLLPLDVIYGRVIDKPYPKRNPYLKKELTSH